MANLGGESKSPKYSLNDLSFCVIIGLLAERKRKKKRGQEGREGGKY